MNSPRARGLWILCCALAFSGLGLLGGCGGGSGGGGTGGPPDNPDPPLTLADDYVFVNMHGLIEVKRHIRVETLFATPDQGDLRLTGTQNTNRDSTEVDRSVPYTLEDGGVLAFAQYQGCLSADEYLGALFGTGMSPATSDMSPAVGLMLREAGAYTEQSFEGTYYLLAFGYMNETASGALTTQYFSFRTSVNLGNSSLLTSPYTININGATSQVDTGLTTSFAFSPTGEVSLGLPGEWPGPGDGPLPVTGLATYGGDVIAVSSAAADGAFPAVAFLIRQSATASDATVSGDYDLMRLLPPRTLGDTQTGFWAFWNRGTFRGGLDYTSAPSGIANFNGVVQETVGGQFPVGVDVVDATGLMKVEEGFIGASTYGVLGANGAIGIWLGGHFSGDMPYLGLFVRR